MIRSLDWIFTFFCIFQVSRLSQVVGSLFKTSPLNSAISRDCLFATFVKHQATEQANDQHRELESGSIASALHRVSKMNVLIYCYIY